MATARTARILASAQAGAHGRLLQLELVEDGALGFTGGQYLIFNTGVPRTDGRQHKRAYSIVSADSDQRVFSICVYGLPEGAGSRALHEAQVGACFPFSGPWGSYLPDDSTPRTSLLLATDTGITAALGLIHGRAFAPQRAHARLVWFAPPGLQLGEPGWVEAQARAAGVAFQKVDCPEVGDVRRAEVLPALALEAFQAHRAERLYLSGDGAALSATRALLTAKGEDSAVIRMETFFNHPARKAAA